MRRTRVLAQGPGQRLRPGVDEHGGTAGRLEQRSRALAHVEQRERRLRVGPPVRPAPAAASPATTAAVTVTRGSRRRGSRR